MTNETTEHWRPFPGEPNYEISSKGRVRSLPRRVRCVVHGQERTRQIKGKILKVMRQDRTLRVNLSSRCYSLAGVMRQVFPENEPLIHA